MILAQIGKQECDACGQLTGYAYIVKGKVYSCCKRSISCMVKLKNKVVVDG